MDRVLACIDNSAYANGVCDHAGWFASDPDVGVEVLHVVEPTDAVEASRGVGPNLNGTPATDPLLDRAVWRLREEGVGPVTSARLAGSFVEIASRHEASVIVMGKRGDLSEAERRRLGSNVDAMVRRCPKPICLTSKLFLPIQRTLVLLDADLSHSAALQFVASDFRLRVLPADVVIVARPDEDAGPKVEWARTTLGTMAADVFPLVSDGLDDAVVQYMQERAADLVVVSRSVVAPDPQAGLLRIEERGLWGMRTPVLIC